MPTRTAELPMGRYIWYSVEQDEEGESDDEDRTRLEQPEHEPEHDEVEGHEDEDVDINTDANARELWTTRPMWSDAIDHLFTILSGLAKM